MRVCKEAGPKAFLMFGVRFQREQYTVFKALVQKVAATCKGLFRGKRCN